MRARRMRRRLLNVFAFTCLAFAIYLVTFVKQEQPASTSKHAQTGSGATGAAKTAH